MSIAVNGYLQAVVYCQLGDQLGLNVLNYKLTSCTEDPASEQLLCDALSALLKPKYADVLVSSASYIGVALRKMEAGGPGAYYYRRNATVGNFDPDPLPRQVAGIISWRTGTSGRRGRGRSYIPFPAEENNTASYVPSAGYLTAVQALRTTILNTGAMAYGDFGAATLALQIKAADSFTYTPVVFGLTPAKWATCRRRGSYGRPNVLPDGLLPVV